MNTEELAAAIGSGVDILDFETGSIDRSSPLLPEGVYTLELKSIERKKNEAKKSEGLHISFITTKDQQSVQGDILHKGWPIREYIHLTPTGGLTADMIRKAVVKLLDGIYGKNTVEHIMPLERHVGKVVDVKLEIDKGDEKFGASNKVKSYIIPR